MTVQKGEKYKKNNQGSFEKAGSWPNGMARVAMKQAVIWVEKKEQKVFHFISCKESDVVHSHLN